MIATAGYPMAKNKAKKSRYEFQADEWLMERAEERANEMGLSLAAYIRFLITQDLERVERLKQGRSE